MLNIKFKNNHHTPRKTKCFVLDLQHKALHLQTAMLTEKNVGAPYERNTMGTQRQKGILCNSDTKISQHV